MITIKLQYDNLNNLIGFTTSGHSDYSESGSDIVCSAVSALTQTALLGLLRFAKEQTHYQIEQGLLTLHIDYPTQESSVILETMVLGLEEIARQYNQYVVLDR